MKQEEIVQYINKYQNMPEVIKYIEMVWNGIEDVHGIKIAVESYINQLKKTSSNQNSIKLEIYWDQYGFKSRRLFWKFSYTDISDVRDSNKLLALAIVVLRELCARINGLESRVYSNHRIRIKRGSTEISVEEAYKLKDEGSQILYDAIIVYGYMKPYKEMTEL